MRRYQVFVFYSSYAILSTNPIWSPIHTNSKNSLAYTQSSWSEGDLLRFIVARQFNEWRILCRKKAGSHNVDWKAGGVRSTKTTTKVREMEEREWENAMKWNFTFCYRRPLTPHIFAAKCLRSEHQFGQSWLRYACELIGFGWVFCACRRCAGGDSERWQGMSFHFIFSFLLFSLAILSSIL